MMKKASEYSKMCDVDVCGAIRMRETDQVHILSADASGFCLPYFVMGIVGNGDASGALNRHKIVVRAHYPKCHDYRRETNQDRTQSAD
jgi:hypothetical protein